MAIGLGEIGGAVIIDHAGNAAGLVEIGSTPLELGDAWREAEHQRQMSARRAAGDADAIGIDTEPGGVGAQIAYRGFHILQRGGELKLGSQPVSYRRGDIAALREPDAERQVALAVSRAEAAAVDAQHRRMRRAGAAARTHNVQSKPPADSWSVLQIRLED